MNDHVTEKRTIIAREDTVLCEDHGHGETSGRIFLPDAGVSDHHVGTVLAISRGWRHSGEDRPIEHIEVGDTVVVKPNRLLKVTVDGVKYIYVSCLDIPMVIKNNKEGDKSLPLVR